MFFSFLSAIGIFVCSFIAGIRVQKLRNEKNRQLFNIMSVTLENWNNFLEDTYSKKELAAIMEKFDGYIKDHK